MNGRRGEFSFRWERSSKKNREIRSVSSILFPIYNLYPSATHLFAPRNLRLSAEAFNVYHQVYHLLFVRAKIKRRACPRYAVKNQRVRLVFPTNPLPSLSVPSIFSIFLLFVKFFFQRPTFLSFFVPWYKTVRGSSNARTRGPRILIFIPSLRSNDAS